jgi:hypothetical protein
MKLANLFEQNESDSEMRELVSQGRVIIEKLKAQGKSPYELIALTNALELAIPNGVVTSQGSPFYGDSVVKLAGRLGMILAALGSSMEPEPSADPNQDFLEKVNQTLEKYRGRLPAHFGIGALDKALQSYNKAQGDESLQRYSLTSVPCALREISVLTNSFIVQVVS